MSSLIDQYSVTKSIFVSVLYVAAIYTSNVYLKHFHFKKSVKSTRKKSDNCKNKKQDEKSELEVDSDSEEEQNEDNKLKRDNPIVIRSRMKFVSFAIAIILLTMYSTHGDWKQLIGAQYYVLKSQSQSVVVTTTWTKYLGQVFQLVGVYLILYSSQIVDTFLFNKIVIHAGASSENSTPNTYTSSSFSFFSLKFFFQLFEKLDVWDFRNLIFAPFTEELVFTAIILYNYKLQNSWWLSLYFGIPHLHHAWELIQEMDSNPNYTIGSIFANCFLQFCYTSLFGHINNVIYLKTKQNLACCFVSHSICNYMGFPNLVPLFSIEPGVTTNSSANHSAATIDQQKKVQKQQLNKLYKYMYWSLMIFGLIQYIKYLTH